MEQGYEDALKRAVSECEAAEAAPDKQSRDGHLLLAKEICEWLICEDPDQHAPLSLLGCVNFALGAYGSAMAAHALSLHLAKACGQVNSLHLYNIANTMYRTYHFQIADTLFGEAVKADPNMSDVWATYAGLMMAYGKPERCEEYARKAIALKPDNVVGHYHLGFALLMQDRWPVGWAEMEWRKKRPDWTRGRYAMIDWDGKEFDGTVIIHAEQGIGDELFYCSLVKRAQALVPRVVVECSQRLVPLLRRSLTCEVYGSLEECVANGAMPQAVLDDEKNKITSERNGEWQSRPRVAAMGSLPFLLGVTREDCSDNHYLRPDPFRRIYWRARLEKLANGRPIVGVAWVGGAYETHKKLRNPPREMFERLDPEKYCLVSVQYTQGAAEQAARMGFHHFQAAIDDLDEQAALISALDYMVSVAQAAMHIAGGLNVPTLALIHQYPKWDCGKAGEEGLPWWSSVRAVRQTSDDWAPVFDELLSLMGEGEVDEIRQRRTKADFDRQFDRFDAMPLTIPSYGEMKDAGIDLTAITIGDTDASPSDLRAAE